jgi:hypothetical protein
MIDEIPSSTSTTVAVPTHPTEIDGRERIRGKGKKGVCCVCGVPDSRGTCGVEVQRKCAWFAVHTEVVTVGQRCKSSDRESTSLCGLPPDAGSVVRVGFWVVTKVGRRRPRREPGKADLRMKSPRNEDGMEIV